MMRRKQVTVPSDDDDVSFVNFSSIYDYIKERKQVTVPSDDEDVCFVLDQHTYMHLYSVGSLKPQSTDIRVAPLEHIVLIPI